MCSKEFVHFIREAGALVMFCLSFDVSYSLFALRYSDLAPEAWCMANLFPHTVKYLVDNLP